ncbi:winged helix-turn-helix domain-containing protein [Actinomadura keratinilytica]|uniref:GntR family transcriptional regulator n=1 Tax=Actinomadura keratinilytica TaxID=547461 RepID=A0ABP7YDK1_9ACTN
MGEELDGMDPLRVQLADRVAAKIADGTYPPGSRIPSTAQLADQYGVSQRTAADAVKLLKERGLVRGVQGRGVFVLRKADGG